MSALALIVTTAGLNKFTSAQAGADIDLTVAEVGVTAADFVVAPTLTALPGEIKRIDTISGEVLPNSIVHMTLRDLSTDAYTVRGFGLYLADGTLFAVYGQAGAIMEKSAVSTLLLALDIQFPTVNVGAIQFGDANFAYPPASEIGKGVAELATQAEVDAGTDAQRIVTPLRLAGRLAGILTAIAGKVSSSRNVWGAGLATGGGDLSADRTITVYAATQAEAEAGLILDKAVVPASLYNILASIAGRALSSTKVWGGGLATGGGDISADRTITVTAASAAETDAGVVGSKAVTPAGLTNILASIAGRALSSTKVWGGGLATGGGDISVDRTITVPKASGADVQAGTDDAKAITPAALAAGFPGSIAKPGWMRHPNGMIEQWGAGVHGTDGRAEIVFPVAFPNAVFGGLATNDAGAPAPIAWHGVGNLTQAGMTIFSATASGVAPSVSGIASYWRAWGY